MAVTSVFGDSGGGSTGLSYELGRVLDRAAAGAALSGGDVELIQTEVDRAARMTLDSATAAASAGPRNAALIRAILRGYDLAEPDATHAVRLLGSVFHGFVSLETAGGFDHSSPGAQESWLRIMDALDTLLRDWPERR